MNSKISQLIPTPKIKQYLESEANQLFMAHYLLNPNSSNKDLDEKLLLLIEDLNYET